MLYKLVIFHDPELKTLAATYPERNEIYVNSAVTPAEFKAYFHGEGNSKSSKQKREVLDQLTLKGWPWERINSLLPNKIKVRRFLVLHELSHLRHKDPTTYHDKSHQEQIEIEIRACLEALVQIQKEDKKIDLNSRKRYNPKKP